ncbi:MAG: FAD-dependent oxidoreductase, partial [Candidatus Hecatellaceae archaeon]
MSGLNGGCKSKIGVFICDCGTNIAGFLDTKRLVEHFSAMDGVEAFGSLHLCSESGLQLIKDKIKECGLERVVVACCTPRLHGELFRRTVEEAGLNRNYLAVANIREQCSWVHWFSREKATEKALDLVEMALASVSRAVEGRKAKVPVERRVLVVGGGVAGITAALNLANSGLEVILVEKTGFLGGHMAKWDKVFPTLDCSICILGPLMAEAYSHPKIKVYTLCELVNVRGAAGNYEVELLRKARYVDLEKCNGCNKCLDVCPVKVPNEYEYGIGERTAIVKPFAEAVPTAPYIDMENCIGCQSCVAVCDQEAINFEDRDETLKVRVGAIILATGFVPCDPRELDEYGYGRYEDVITGAELERLVNPAGPTRGRLIRPSNGSTPRSIAFIQCVGSRSSRVGRPYCS